MIAFIMSHFVRVKVGCVCYYISKDKQVYRMPMTHKKFNFMHTLELEAAMVVVNLGGKTC